MKYDHCKPGAILWVNQIGDNVGECSKYGERIKVNVEITCPANSETEVRLSDYPNGFITAVWFNKEENAFKFNISYDGLIDTEDWKFIQGSMKEGK